MDARIKWFTLALLLIALMVMTAPAATAQTSFSLTVYDPTGAIEVTQVHPPRLADLAGKTICEVSTGLTWEAHRTFPRIRELLQKQYPTVKIIPYTEFPAGSEAIDNDDTADLVKSKGCQAAIVGNGG